MTSKKFRIAFISYEYSTDIPAGGIATYVYEAARMMEEVGWNVEIFVGSFDREGIYNEDNIIVHRILIKDQFDFKNKVYPVFLKRHNLNHFDICESPEINGNGLEIMKNISNTFYITKLHTPVTLQLRLLNWYQPFYVKLRFVIGSFLRGKIDLGFWRLSDNLRFNDVDYQTTVTAQGITSPSIALKQWAVKYWKIPGEKIHVLPNPFSPTPLLLEQNYNTERKLITFIGKLNIHKGLVNLTKAIPEILTKNPDHSFCFIGKDMDGPLGYNSMMEYIITKLPKFKSRLIFTGAINPLEVAEYLNKTKICIFPSIWEAFGYVVLEAMSAGIPVIVSKGSGMAEIIGNNKYGLLINPKSSLNIGRVSNRLLKNPKLLNQLSIIGRERVKKFYSRKALSHLHSDYYTSIINSFNKCELQ